MGSRQWDRSWVQLISRCAEMLISSTEKIKRFGEAKPSYPIRAYLPAFPVSLAAVIPTRIFRTMESAISLTTPFFFWASSHQTLGSRLVTSFPSTRDSSAFKLVEIYSLTPSSVALARFPRSICFHATSFLNSVFPTPFLKNHLPHRNPGQSSNLPPTRTSCLFCLSLPTRHRITTKPSWLEDPYRRCKHIAPLSDIDVTLSIVFTG